MRKSYKPDNTEPTAVIDTIRITAPSPSCFVSPYAKRHGIIRNGLRWRKHEIKNLIQSYVYTLVQLSRYRDGKYEKKLEEAEAPFQNNQSPYNCASASVLIEQAIKSYTALSNDGDSFDCSMMLRLSLIECAFDLPAMAPTLRQLKDYVSRGKGSAHRSLKIITQDKIELTYDKYWDEWRDKSGNVHEVSETEYFQRFFSWDWCIYAGSKNYRIAIYRKDDKIRHEIRYKRSSVVKKLLRERHIVILKERAVVENLFRETARRIYLLYQVKAINEIEIAIKNALSTFATGEKQEPRIQGCMAFNIDGDTPTHAINQVFYIIVQIDIYKRLTCLSLTIMRRIRGPPCRFFSMINLIQSLHSNRQQYTAAVVLLPSHREYHQLYNQRIERERRRSEPCRGLSPAGRRTFPPPLHLTWDNNT